MAKKEIIISNVLIGEKHPVFMIAEIGINHNGDLSIAKKLVDAAFACNWNCVKFQKRDPDICVPEHQKNVMRETPWGKITYLEYRYKVEFGHKEYDYIDRYCKEKPVLWTASAWDMPSLEFILKYNVPFIKVPSAKLTELEFLRQVAKSGKPIMLSTGMSSVEEVDCAVNVLERESSSDYLLMHTNSTYPTPEKDINLLIIQFLKNRYKCIVGYSGHEYDLEPTVIAVVMGARVIERHVTLSHSLWGTDQFASLEIHAMNMLYKRIKNIDVIIGDGIKRVTEKEYEIRKKLRG